MWLAKEKVINCSPRETVSNKCHQLPNTSLIWWRQPHVWTDFHGPLPLSQPLNDRIYPKSSDWFWKILRTLVFTSFCLQILSSNLWGKTFSYFNLCSLLTLRRKCDGQNGDSKEKHEERLAYLTAQVIQCQKCNIIGWEVDCTKKNLEQENIAPYVLEVENQAKKGHEVCKSVVNKNERHLS